MRLRPSLPSLRRPRAPKPAPTTNPMPPKVEAPKPTPTTIPAPLKAEDPKPTPLTKAETPKAEIPKAEDPKPTPITEPSTVPPEAKETHAATRTIRGGDDNSTSRRCQARDRCVFAETSKPGGSEREPALPIQGRDGGSRSRSSLIPVPGSRAQCMLQNSSNSRSPIPSAIRPSNLQAGDTEPAAARDRNDRTSSSQTGRFDSRS